jgi:hypothetical protein
VLHSCHQQTALIVKAKVGRDLSSGGCSMQADADVTSGPLHVGARAGIEACSIANTYQHSSTANVGAASLHQGRSPDSSSTQDMKQEQQLQQAVGMSRSGHPAQQQQQQWQPAHTAAHFSSPLLGSAAAAQGRAATLLDKLLRKHVHALVSRNDKPHSMVPLPSDKLSGVETTPQL